MKKVFPYIGWILFGISLIGLVYFAIPKNTTCDFRGYVQQVEIDTENDCTWLSVTMVFDETPTKIKVGNRTSVSYHKGEKTTTDKIKVGDMVDMDVKKQQDDVNYYEAKWVRVYPKE